MNTFQKKADFASSETVLDLIIKYTQFNNTKFIKIDSSNFKSFFGDSSKEKAQSILCDLDSRKVINLTITSSSYIITVLEEAYKNLSKVEQEIPLEISIIKKNIDDLSVIGNSLKPDDKYDVRLEKIHELASNLINLLKVSGSEHVK